MTSGSQEPVGLIAGAGRMPILTAQAMRRMGRRVIVVGLCDSASSDLVGLADEFYWCGIARPGAWIRALARHGVREAVMIGGVRKKSMFSPFRILRYVPDLTAVRLWYGRLRHDKRDNAVLLAVAEALGRRGIQLVSSVKYCEEHLAHEGVMTCTGVPAAAEADVEFGWRIARASADLDIGQSVAVKEQDIIAVEAMEGTDAMIRRAGRLCRVGGWTLVKVARSNQDMRFDVPTIGPSTIRNLKDAKCVCLVVEAGRTLIVDKPQTLALADKLNIAVVGRKA